MNARRIATLDSMKPETNKWAYGLAGGAIIPILFFMLAMSIPGKLALYAGLPLRLPVVIYEYLFPDPPDLEPIFTAIPSDGFFPFVLIGNFILYFLLIYLGLSWKQMQSMPHLK
jgi:hypothetical protein